MSMLLDVARLAAALNVVLLLALGYVWVSNYRQHGARHTLALIVFAAFLLVQNTLWIYFYVFHPGYVGWFINADMDMQMGMVFLCGLETLALAFLTWITWK